MHIVHGIAGISRAHGGTSTFVVELANAQANLPGNRVTLLTGEGSDEELLVAPEVNRVRHHRQSDIAGIMAHLCRNQPVDLIHAHGLWQLQSHALGVFARANGIAFVLGTHGMLEANALQIKKWRKRAALLCYQRFDLVAANALSATAAPEAANLRRAGFRQPILVAPPGVSIPVESELTLPDVRAVRTAVVLARLHPVKNLVALIAAWAMMRPQGWKLTISGPDPDGYSATVRDAIRAAGVEPSCSVIGPQYGDAKAKLFGDSSLFILPSFSENFGIVVAEALSYGVPVIATTGTPWQLLPENDCGWWVAPDPRSLANALRAATALPAEQLRAMGRRGRTVAEQQFRWTNIAAAVQQGYQWLIEGGPVPAAVQLATPV